MTGYRIERLSPHNLHHLVTLYRRSFNARVTLDFLKKKYDTKIFGAAYVGFIAFHAETGEPAAYYGVFPVTSVIEGKNILCAQSGDTMTAPEHQGKGLFVALAKATYELAAKEGIAFVFGFPNENSYPGFERKLQWKFPKSVNHYFIKTGILPFDKLAKKVPLFGALYKRYVDFILRNLKDATQFENSLSAGETEEGFIKHDRSFYSYKSYSEFYLVNLNGLRCIMKVDGRLWIGDIESTGDMQYLLTIAESRRLARRLGCSTLQISCTEGSRFDLLMVGNFDRKTSIPAGFINLSEKTDPAGLSYTAFDFDTY